MITHFALNFNVRWISNEYSSDDEFESELYSRDSNLEKLEYLIF